MWPGSHGRRASSVPRRSDRAAHSYRGGEHRLGCVVDRKCSRDDTSDAALRSRIPWGARGGALVMPGGGEPRARLWRSLGASEPETQELLVYARNSFDHSQLPQRYPLADEPFVAVWNVYAAEADRAGVLACLRARLP